MIDNDTHIVNFTGTNATSISGVSAKRCILYAVVTICSITFIIGLVSWILIKKFRHFRNYIFLSIIFNNIINLVMTDLIKVLKKSDSVILRVTGGLSFLYFRMCAHCWLTILCWLFYVDLVKVFNSAVSKKYLKISLFAWGVPIVIIVCNVVVMTILDEPGDTIIILYSTATFFSLFVNLLIYLKVLYTLFNVRCANDRWRRVRVATAIFLVSGNLFLLLPFSLLGQFRSFMTPILIYLPHVALDVYFFVVRINRDTWKTYYKRRTTLGGSTQVLC